MAKKKEIESISLDEAIDRDIGKIGTPERDEFEKELKELKELTIKESKYTGSILLAHMLFCRIRMVRDHNLKYPFDEKTSKRLTIDILKVLEDYNIKNIDINLAIESIEKK